MACSNFEDGLAGDAFENVIGFWWGDDGAVSDDEDVFGCAFADVACCVEEDGFVEASVVSFFAGEG